jgi:hypothetical protein
VRRLALALLPAIVAGCGVFSQHPPAKSAQAGGAPVDESFRGVAVGKRPATLGLVREGDPYPAAAVAVRVGGGPVLATALAAVVEARLLRAQWPVTVHVTRDGFDIRGLVRPTPTAAATPTATMEQLVAALRGALLAPIADAGEGGEDLRLARARVAALRTLALDDDALADVALCRGELRLTHAEATPAALMVTASATEAARASAASHASVAFAFVGPRAVVDAGQRAVAEGPEWPSSASAPAPATWPTGRSVHAFVRTERGPSRLSVAVRVPLRSAALRVAERATDPSSPLVARLRGLSPTPFALRQVAATVHDSGACLTVETEAALASGSGAGDADTAAAAALVIESELLAELSERNDDRVASCQIRALSDPREAAAAAANWALSADAVGDGKIAVPAFVFGAAGARAREDQATLTGAFAKAIADGGAEWSRSALENRVLVEAEQGQLWVLLAAPCPLNEPASRAGLTALTLSAVASSGMHRGVAVEPWLAPDGYGLLVHAARSPNETTDALAIRVANAAARLLALEPPPATAIADARASLMVHLGGREHEHRAAIAEALLPTALTRLTPWGSASFLSRASDADARVRWGGLASGPLRAAVLANADSAQATTVLRAIDRWIPRIGRPRTCTSVDDVKMSPDPLTYAVERGDTNAPTALAYSFDGSAGAGRGAALIAALILEGAAPSTSPLARALGPSGRVTARVVGRGSRSMLLVELHTAEPLTDEAVGEAKQAIETMSLVDGPTASAARARFALQLDEQRLSPEERVIALWRGEPVAAAPTDGELHAFQATALPQAAARVVRPAPSD